MTAQILLESGEKSGASTLRIVKKGKSMQKIVVDANIVVKWFITEEFSNLALMIRDRFVEGQIEILAPTLLNYEVLNALRYSKLFPQEDLVDAAISLENYGILQFPLIGDYGQKTISLAVEYNISIYDAAYVALTDVLEVQAYSADRILVENVHQNYQEKFLFITKLEKNKKIRKEKEEEE